MSSIMRVIYGDGELADQLFQLKVSALRNHDIPLIWRMTEPLVELVIRTAGRRQGRWPGGYISENRLFDVPVDYVRHMPHLLCEDGVIYPYSQSISPIFPLRA